MIVVSTGVTLFTVVGVYVDMVAGCVSSRQNVWSSLHYFILLPSFFSLHPPHIPFLTFLTSTHLRGLPSSLVPFHVVPRSSFCCISRFVFRYIINGVCEIYTRAYRRKVLRYVHTYLLIYRSNMNVCLFQPPSKFQLAPRRDA